MYFALSWLYGKKYVGHHQAKRSAAEAAPEDSFKLREVHFITKKIYLHLLYRCLNEQIYYRRMASIHTKDLK